MIKEFSSLTYTKKITHYEITYYLKYQALKGFIFIKNFIKYFSEI